MTRRERLERKLQKRQEWAEGRKAKADAAYKAARAIVGNIPMGQPVLIGHHSEKRHRRDLERADNAMGRMVESSKMAEHHTSKAGGIADQLDSSIFSDDPDAIEQLTARIAELEADRDTRKAANKAYTKGGWDAVAAVLSPERLAKAQRGMAVCPYEKVPFPPYSLQNLGARIRTAKKRMDEVKKEQARRSEAEAAPGGLLVKIVGDWSRVTFAEKPERSTIDALKTAGFRWAAGSWHGPAAGLPDSLKQA